MIGGRTGVVLLDRARHVALEAEQRREQLGPPRRARAQRLLGAVPRLGRDHVVVRRRAQERERGVLRKRKEIWKMQEGRQYFVCAVVWCALGVLLVLGKRTPLWSVVCVSECVTW